MFQLIQREQQMFQLCGSSPAPITGCPAASDFRLHSQGSELGGLAERDIAPKLREPFGILPEALVSDRQHRQLPDRNSQKVRVALAQKQLGSIQRLKLPRSGTTCLHRVFAEELVRPLQEREREREREHPFQSCMAAHLHDTCMLASATGSQDIEAFACLKPFLE